MGTETVLPADKSGKNPPKKWVLTNWEERTSESFNEVSQFASDLAASLENRISTCITDGVGKSMFFDIEQVFIHMCGERLPNNRVWGDLEVFEAESFERFFKEVYSLKHIVTLDDERFDDRLQQSVFQQWKDAIRFLVWDKAMKNELLSCLQPIRENGVTTSDSSAVADPETKMMKLSIAPQEPSKLNLHTSFIFEFENHPAFCS